MARLLTGLLIASLVLAAGCKHANRRDTIPANVPGAQFVPPPPPSPAQGFALPPGARVTPPPGAIIQNPAPAPSFPNTPPPAAPPAPPPTPPGPTGSFYVPPGTAQAQWRPAEPSQGVQPAEARAGTPRIQLSAPEPLFGEWQGPGKSSPPAVNEQRSTEPPLVQEKRARSTLPGGIPQFAKAGDSVYAGLRPSIEDGLDWLQASAFRTVLHVHAPGENTDADRKQVERLGMNYVALEVSPQTLTKAKVDEFAAQTREVARHPLFVYDQDGSLAGPLWYLYFRTVENHADDVARVRASALGLREDREGAHRLMWLAVQKYLESQN